jgi:hypothetical protein
LYTLPPLDFQNDKDSPAKLDLLLSVGAIEFEKTNTIRDVSWLKDNGICMDGIMAGTSTIPHAGRGAFATRHFAQGATIAPVPLIHIPNKKVLTVYAAKKQSAEYHDDDDEYYNKDSYQYCYYEDAEFKQRDISKPIGQQLFLNYQFSHKNSSMLLSPYGSITSLINHGSGSSANARMVWAREWMTHPEWMEMRPEELYEYRYAGLGWNLVALRDIQPGEEILINYGHDWEQAWNQHVEQWYSRDKLPTGTSGTYLPAAELNENLEKVLSEAIETEVDFSFLGYGVTLWCYYQQREKFDLSDDHDAKAKKMNQLKDHKESVKLFNRKGKAEEIRTEWKGNDQRENKEDVTEVEETSATAEAIFECRPVAKYKSEDTGKTLFVAEILEWAETGEQWQLHVKDVLLAAPACIFHFEDIPYTTAHQQSWAFRHPIMFPDNLFPKAWMNRMP